MLVQPPPGFDAPASVITMNPGGTTAVVSRVAGARDLKVEGMSAKRTGRSKYRDGVVFETVSTEYLGAPGIHLPGAATTSVVVSSAGTTGGQDHAGAPGGATQAGAGPPGAASSAGEPLLLPGGETVMPRGGSSLHKHRGTSTALPGGAGQQDTALSGGEDSGGSSREERKNVILALARNTGYAQNRHHATIAEEESASSPERRMLRDHEDEGRPFFGEVSTPLHRVASLRADHEQDPKESSFAREGGRAEGGTTSCSEPESPVGRAQVVAQYYGGEYRPPVSLFTSFADRSSYDRQAALLAGSGSKSPAQNYHDSAFAGGGTTGTDTADMSLANAQFSASVRSNFHNRTPSPSSPRFHHLPVAGAVPPLHPIRPTTTGEGPFSNYLSELGVVEAPPDPKSRPDDEDKIVSLRRELKRLVDENNSLRQHSTSLGAGPHHQHLLRGTSNVGPQQPCIKGHSGPAGGPVSLGGGPAAVAPPLRAAPQQFQFDFESFPAREQISFTAQAGRDHALRDQRVEELANYIRAQGQEHAALQTRCVQLQQALEERSIEETKQLNRVGRRWKHRF